jgi:hypothetical protein
MGVRKYLRRKRRRANAAIIRCLAEKRLRVGLIVYRTLPRALAVLAALVAIRAVIIYARVKESPGMFYLDLTAKAVTIMAVGIILYEGLKRARKCTDKLLRRCAVRS